MQGGGRNESSYIEFTRSLEAICLWCQLPPPSLFLDAVRQSSCRVRFRSTRLLGSATRNSWAAAMVELQRTVREFVTQGGLATHGSCSRFHGRPALGPLAEEIALVNRLVVSVDGQISGRQEGSPLD